MFDCKHHAINNEGSHDAIDWANYGSGRYWDGGCERENYCGELGDYAMFESKVGDTYGKTEKEESRRP
jgi:hypothetical protein